MATTHSTAQWLARRRAASARSGAASLAWASIAEGVAELRDFRRAAADAEAEADAEGLTALARLARRASRASLAEALEDAATIAGYVTAPNLRRPRMATTTSLTLTEARRRLAAYFAPPTVPEYWTLAADLRAYRSANPTTVALAAEPLAAARPFTEAPPEVAEAIRRIAAWASDTAPGRFRSSYYSDFYAIRRRRAAEAALATLANFRADGDL